MFYRSGGYSVATVSGVEHFGRRALARPHTVCEIALGTFVRTLRMELPAAGGTTFFDAEVDLQWSVVDPHLAAVEVVTDVAQRLTAPVLERLREVTADFPVDSADRANRAVTQRCADGRWDDLGSELGLRVRLYVRLRVDDRTITHVNEIRDAHASANVTRVHQNTFRAMLQGGELEQLSYMLAAQPEAAKEFLEKIRQEGRQDEKERVERVFGLMAGGQIHSHQVEDQVLGLLNGGHQRVQGPIGSLPAHRDRPQLESGRRPRRDDESGRGAYAGYAERTDRTEHPGYADRTDHTEHPGYADRSSRDGRSGRGEHTDDTGGAGPYTDYADYTDHPNGSEYAEYAEFVDDGDGRTGGRGSGRHRRGGDAFTPDWVVEDRAGDPDAGPGGRGRRDKPADDGPPAARPADDEPPRRRNRGRNDGWSWAEED
ncbi:hypothetical protein NX801_06535 [Streptomyces sp. LP05-1]|uniref:PE-PGRS family protein n=1 Tax=Streptomyces pyxinae TaxID=2970734 RepID=A0ABT2CD64_9ACTN|nr:hypothetical protein [Streptomyces sp. LP05-1]MCS0635318.1 hypothetical protein [Streptomyces sp. LP05-1]